MSKQQDNSNEPLERMLRRWGATEAIENTSAPAAPGRAASVPPRRRKKPPIINFRWISAGVAAAVLVAAVGFWLGSMLPRPTANQGIGWRKTVEPEAKLKQQLAMAKAQRDATTRRAAKETLALRTTLAEKQRQYEADKRMLLGKFETRLAELRHETRTKTAALTEAKKTSLQLAKELDELQRKWLESDAKAAHTDEDLKKAKRQLREETARLRKMHNASLASAEKVRSEVADIRARRARELAELQRAYFGAAAPGQAGLQARQTAARRSDMLARAGGVRRLVKADKTRRLIDRLEVVLMKLDMLERYDLKAEQSFASLLREGDILGRLDDALATAGEDVTVRVWLYEARLILTGVQSVG